MTDLRYAAAVALILLAAAGCSDDGKAGKPADPSTPAAVASDGTNFGACSDGECEVSVQVGTEITLPEKTTGVTHLQVTEISPGTVKFTVDTSGHIETGPGGTVTMNHLGVDVPAIQGTTAIVRLSIR